MIGEELKQLKTGPGELRKFGLTVGAVFIFLGLWFWWRHKPFHPCFFVAGAPLIFLGLAYPRGLRLVYLGWMSGAFVLGFVVSTVLMALFFYFVMTPIGLLARCFGKDFLSRKWGSGDTSYWIVRDLSVSKEKVDYERQF